MTTTTLALRIDAPMQSWGVRSRFVSRDTAAEPTKSGIVGLLAAARGIDRDDTDAIVAIAALRMGVRADREGLVERDFHTAANVPNTEGRAHRTVVSDRYYLADALFLVALQGDERFLTELEEAVRRPRWPLFFGRKAFVPANPLLEDEPERRRRWGTGIFHAPLGDVLCEHPWLENRAGPRRQVATSDGAELLRTVTDVPASCPEAELRHDHPLSFRPRDRRFEPRTVRVDHTPLTTTMIPGDRACS